MRRRRHLITLCDDVERFLPSLRRMLEQSAANDVCQPDDDDFRRASAYEIGNVYGRYAETIVRREVSRGGGPSWFDPRENVGQYGITLRDGLRIFVQVELNELARSAPSTFDREICSIAVPPATQIDLFRTSA